MATLLGVAARRGGWRLLPSGVRMATKERQVVLRCFSTKKEDDLRRDIASLDPNLLEQTHMNKEIDKATDQVEASGDLMYQGVYHENWREILEEAKKCYPVRAGKRQNNFKRRFRHKMKAIALQHEVLRAQRIQKHFREMENRKIRAQERREANWTGPRLNS